MSNLSNNLVNMIESEPTLSDMEKDSLITKTEILVSEDSSMTTNEKIISVIAAFRELSMKDRQLVIETLQDIFNTERKEREIESKEQLLKQQQEEMLQATLESEQDY
tara:strand:+ start:289 stop:609 length:321 start_codon:yes stop_codon:yes gene_type:complete